MSLVWTEGFDFQGSVNDLPGFTDTPAITYFVAGRFSGRAAGLTATTHKLNRVIDPISVVTLGFAFRLNNEDIPCSLIIRFLSASEVNLAVELTDTSIKTWSGDVVTGTLLGTVAAPYKPYTWSYCAVQISFDSQFGSLYMNIDGLPAVDLSGYNTSPDASNMAQGISWQFVSSSTTSDVYLDDMYMCDRAGTGIYTGFLGVVTISSILPNANTATGFVSSTGLPNWQNVDDRVMDSDSTFNSSGQAVQDTFTGHSSLAQNAIVLAVEPEIAMRAEGLGYNIQTVLISGHTQQNGVSVTPQTSYQRVSDITVTDPATGKAWTATAVNNLKFGYRNH